MTYEHATPRKRAAEANVVRNQPGAWLLPAIGSGILTLVWGAFTANYIYHMAILPLP